MLRKHELSKTANIIWANSNEIYSNQLLHSNMAVEYICCFVLENFDVNTQTISLYRLHS